MVSTVATLYAVENIGVGPVVRISLVRAGWVPCLRKYVQWSVFRCADGKVYRGADGKVYQGGDGNLL
jgi:hypothetical protein